ncbi:MAG: hypothetical protein EZS28_051758 [Streblomastix strix]|uniref:Uncharacterized protein n=1 Tax=Streblomastix strix TaxID=222440 RepID=A0A5J4T5Q2_9EUKA|nr:MAG: hypothetical protein EZS28_051758 [Streblomastix strix]
MGYTSDDVNVPLGFISTYLPNKYLTARPFYAPNCFGSIDVIQLFVVGQYNRINPIARYATLAVVSSIQQ